MATPAWTAPTTWAPGNVPTAVQFNAQLRDNPLHVATPAMCIVRNSATQALPSGGVITAATAIAFGAELYDSDAFHSVSTNTSRMTVPTGLGGYYHFETTVILPASAASASIIGVAVNGALYKQLLLSGASAGVSYALSGGIDLPLAVGDYVETWVINVGAAVTLAIEANNAGARSSLRKISN